MKNFFQHRFSKYLYTVIFSLLVFFQVLAGNEPILTGSFIINMGVTPQTVNNGLKPYGMVYDLVQNYRVPIKWVISSSKVKDGVDFSHNGISYMGGPFIVPAEYRTAAVNARITYWQGQGVVGATTVSPITVEVNMTIRSMPLWTIDAQNGAIAQAYLDAALIPSTGYNKLAPSALTCCNDIFVMPHADPTWAVHSRLFTWNLDCDGAIWLACHAGSAMEDLFNPANKSQQMNYLSKKTGNATGAGPYEENSLILWGNHSAGSPPYSYFYPTDPIMQFMGILDGATQNGSEQIYLPKVAWNAGAKVYVTDPSQANVPSLSPGPATIMVSGRGFDDPLRGRVMMEAGHSHNKASGPENIAAQRAFMNFSFLVISEKAVVPAINFAATSLASNSANTLSFNLPVGVLASNYTITWYSSCGGAFSPTNGQTTTYTAPNLATATPCVISVSIQDACGRTSSDSKAVTVGGCNLAVTPTITNVSCTGGSTSGAINMAITGGTSPTWTWTRISPSGTGNGSGTAITGLSVGTYDVTVSAGGCTKSFQSIISASPAVTATATGTNPLCFGASTGSIAVSPSGGTAPFTYAWGGGITTQNRSAIAAGVYNVTVTDAKGCTATASTTLTAPADMVITPTITQVACFGGATGAISIAVTGGTGTKTYAWSNGATTQNLTGLAAGTYTVTVTDANGCIKKGTHIVSQPTTGIALSATSVDAGCGSVKGSIDLTVTGGTSPYTYLWSNAATTQDLTALNAGTYSVTVTDAKGCTKSISKTISQGASTLSINGTIVGATCNGASNGSITLTVTGGTAPITYNWGGGITTQNRTGLVAGTYSVTATDALGCSFVLSQTVGQPAVLAIATTNVNSACATPATGKITLATSGGTAPYTYNWGGGITTQNRTGLGAGTYNVTATDAKGCTATASATLTAPADMVITPTLTQVACFGEDGGAISLAITGGTGTKTYAWSNGATTQNLTGLVAGTYTVTVTDANGCSKTSSSTITQPATGMTTTNTATNYSCVTAKGAIDLTINGGTAPFTYAWSNGATTQDLTGLDPGTYTVNVTDSKGCTSFSIRSIKLIPAFTLSSVIVNSTCPTPGTGSITLSVSGGTSPFTYDWADVAGTTNTQNRTALVPGTYSVVVTDAAGCTASISATVTALQGLPNAPNVVNH